MNQDYQKEVIISGVNFPVKRYHRSATDDMISRFGSPEKGQTNLDLLKAFTQESFRGGMFQRAFVDPERVSALTGLYFNEVDEKLYLAADWPTTTGGTTGEQVVASCAHGGRVFYVIYKSVYSGGEVAGNSLYSYDPVTDTIAGPLTLATALSTSAHPVTSIVSHGDMLYISSGYVGGGIIAHRYNPASNTCAALSSVSHYFRRLASFRDKLYGFGRDSVFYLITNETSTGTATRIKSVGNNDPDYDNVHNVLEFNGALWLLKSDGLFRYDGIDVVCVVPDRQSQSFSNYSYSAVWNGALYFTRDNTLWRFDGTNLESLQDFSSEGLIIGLTPRDDRLWVLLRGSDIHAVSSPKTGDGSSGTFSIYAYNGVGFFNYLNIPLTNIQYVTPMLASVSGYSFVILPTVTVNFSEQPQHSTIRIMHFKHSHEFLGWYDNGGTPALHSQVSGEIISSDIDAGYPSVNKCLEGIAFDMDDISDSADYPKIYIQTNTGSGYGDWQLIYDRSAFRKDDADRSLFVDDYYLFDQAGFLDSEPLIFKRLRVKIVFSNTVEDTVPRFKSFTLRYTVQPKLRMKWQFTLGLFTDIEADITANTRREIIYGALRSGLPLNFLDIDYATVSAVTSVDLPPLGESEPDVTYTATLSASGEPLCAVGDAIATYDPSSDLWLNARVADVQYNDVTNITVYSLYPLPSGPYGKRTPPALHGSTAFQVIVDQLMRKSHVVHITSIDNEPVLLDGTTENATAGRSDYQSEITITVTEV